MEQKDKIYAVEGNEYGTNTTLYNAFFYNKSDAISHKEEVEKQDDYIDWFEVVEYDIQ